MELNKLIINLFCDPNVTGDISLFVTKDKTKYFQVSPNKDVSVGEVLSDEQIVCYFEDKRDYIVFWPVRCGKVQMCMVYGDVKDTVRTVKLRIQDQLGILASHVTVNRRMYQFEQVFGPRGKCYSVPDSQTMSSIVEEKILVLPHVMQSSEK